MMPKHAVPPYEFPTADPWPPLPSPRWAFVIVPTTITKRPSPSPHPTAPYATRPSPQLILYPSSTLLNHSPSSSSFIKLSRATPNRLLAITNPVTAEVAPFSGSGLGTMPGIKRSSSATPSGPPPKKRTQSTRLPVFDAPSHPLRITPDRDQLLSPPILPAGSTTSFSTVVAVFGAVRAFISALFTATTQNEYTRIFACLSDIQLASLYLGALPAHTLSILEALVAGKSLDWNDVPASARLTLSSTFNVMGSYIYIGREKDAKPFMKGTYHGSGGALSEQTVGGRSGLIGILKRVMVQHCGPSFRAQPRNRSTFYFKAFKSGETYQDHIFVPGHLLSLSDISHVLGRTTSSLAATSSSTSDLSIPNMHLGLVRLLEAVGFLLFGFYRDIPELLQQELLKIGFTIPTLICSTLNRSFGFELADMDGDAHRLRSAQGGRLASLVFQNACNAAGIRKGSLTAYLQIRYGKEISLEWNKSGGYATRDKEWERKVTRFRDGLFLQWDLSNRVQNPPELVFSRRPNKALFRYLPEELRAEGRARFALRFGLRKTYPNGDKMILKDYTRPPPGQLVWRMTMGELDSLGVPTGVNMSLSAYLLKPGKDLNDNLTMDDVTPYRMPHGEHVVFSDASVERWTSDERVAQRERIMDGVNWDFSNLWAAYKAWVTLVYMTIPVCKDKIDIDMRGEGGAA
ncbi:hypothetical protein JCM24511_07427 [Saitozyma sp. JCM 24511]|nr:hypothetical protein JCM24511_07427 [Saitozyma sp. JCM 24511]